MSSSTNNDVVIPDYIMVAINKNNNSAEIANIIATMMRKVEYTRKLNSQLTQDLLQEQDKREELQDDLDMVNAKNEKLEREKAKRVKLLMSCIEAKKEVIQDRDEYRDSLEDSRKEIALQDRKIKDLIVTRNRDKKQIIQLQEEIEHIKDTTLDLEATVRQQNQQLNNYNNTKLETPRLLAKHMKRFLRDLQRIDNGEDSEPEPTEDDDQEYFSYKKQKTHQQDDS